MTLSQPNGKVVLPSVIRTQPNGALDPRLLTYVELSRKDSTDLRFKMAELPARGMRAWHAWLTKQGLDIRTTGRYRDLPGQWYIFGGGDARYKPATLAEWTAAAPSNRKTWPYANYIAPGTGLPALGRAEVARILHVTIPDTNYWVRFRGAMSAVPGTSNHGFGCADDLAEYLNGVLLNSIRSGTLQVLYASGATFGFCWSTSSENWHVEWMMGDNLPQAVLDYENQQNPGHPEPPPTPPPLPQPVYDDEMRLYRDTRYQNVFLVNGDVTTVGPNLYNSYATGGVPLVQDVHDQSLFSFMRKSGLKRAQLVRDQSSVDPEPTFPADLA